MFTFNSLEDKEGQGGEKYSKSYSLHKNTWMFYHFYDMKLQLLSGNYGVSTGVSETGASELSMEWKEAMHHFWFSSESLLFSCRSQNQFHIQ